MLQCCELFFVFTVHRPALNSAGAADPTSLNMASTRFSQWECKCLSFSDHHNCVLSWIEILSDTYICHSRKKRENIEIVSQRHFSVCQQDLNYLLVWDQMSQCWTWLPPNDSAFPLGDVKLFQSAVVPLVSGSMSSVALFLVASSVICKNVWAWRRQYASPDVCLCRYVCWK